MKSLTKAIAVASLATVATAANAGGDGLGLSTTIGAVSDYYYRGVNLGDAGAQMSFDAALGGFYAGVWAIDDNSGDAGYNDADGFEYDIYFGYNLDLDGIELGIGVTAYEYTYTSDSELEVNLSAGIAGFGLSVAAGIAESNADGADDETDYTVVELSYGAGPWGIMVGMVDIDESDDKIDAEAEHKWAEISYSAEVATVDVVATIGKAFEAEEGGTDEGSVNSEYITFAVSKSFDL